MTEKELRESVKKPRGGYFFWGDEDYLKRHYVSAIRSAVITDESVAPFNEILFDQETFSPEALREALAAPPVMAEKKLVRVALDEYSSLSESTRKELDDIYSEINEDESVLVISVLAGGFDGGTDKKPTAQLKSLASRLNAVAFPLQTESKLIRWLSRHFSEHGISASEETLRFMLRLCGRSMSRLSGEADKASAYALAHGLNCIDSSVISAVASETPEEDAFRLANAVLSGDGAGALDSLGRAKKRGENPIRLLSAVSSVICDMAAVSSLAEAGFDKRGIAGKLKMHEYKTGLYMRATGRVSHEAILSIASMCAEADEKMKSSSLGFIPLERLICSACSARR